MHEAETLPLTLDCLTRQSMDDFMVWICVNQPDDWWADPGKKAICENNRQTLDYLNGLDTLPIKVLDRSSPGKGWSSRAYGVGLARKTTMDYINSFAQVDDLIVSLDADTWVGEEYLENVLEVFRKYPKAVALSNPYYHRLTGDKYLDRAILRYEIYMRHYVINMWRIGSPYQFTALGSAMAVPVWSYRKIGGMTPKKSGEDFYFLQKLRKTGWICNYNQSRVYPATRYSDRVFFGTGPALIKGSQGNWKSYPIYSHILFDKIKEAYEKIPELYLANTETPLSSFLREQFKNDDPLGPLRDNASSAEQFARAFHEKLDGLRLLQFLKSSHDAAPRRDEENLMDFMQAFFAKKLETCFSSHEKALFCQLCFESSSVELMDKIRNLLVEIETEYQQNDRP